MTEIRTLNHVAIVVADIEKALGFWRDTLGMAVGGVREVPEQKSAIAFLPLHGSELELVQPTDPESGLGKYLAKRGPGLHHLCLEVPDLDAMMARLRERGVRLTSEKPMLGAGGQRMIFIHPESSGGVLVELYEAKQ